MDTTTTTSNNDNSLNAAMDIDSPSERTPLHGPSPADYGFPNNHRLTQAPSHPSSHRSHSHHQEQRLLRLKIAATTLSFSVLGLFTSSTGALLWSIKRHYDLADRQVSLVFLFVVLGYVSGAQLNAPLHRRLGQRGVAALGPAAHVIAALCAAAHPPFAVLLICVGLGAFGNGALDGTWSSWAGGLDKASTVSGLLHGAFSVGAAVGPTLVGLLISTAEGRWYHWYYVLVSPNTWVHNPHILRTRF
jgi:fucose permease